MSGYTKLFGSILDSTVWKLPLPSKVVWVTLLAMKDRHGVVEASIPGLADRAGVTLEECETALAAFLSPDRYSRTKDSDGRRIEEIDGGWRVLNSDKYTEKMSAEDRRERDAERQQRRRDKMKSRDSSRDAVTNPQSHDMQMEIQKKIQIKPEQSAPVPSEPPAAAPVLVFPCAGKITEWPLTEAWLVEARAAFPRMDVLADIRVALAKVNTGAVPRKTAAGMSRFLMAWLGRTNDRLPAGSKPIDPRCDWHREVRNDSKPSRFPSLDCPRCKHFVARAGKREGPPVDIGEFFAAKTREAEEHTAKELAERGEKFKQQRANDAGDAAP